ncbi:MAG: glycoside hydrolase family 3 C-terminal domain-containing protein [Myxococcales bacterium]|nr:glycoside hydrolase family 3 C-terminal domain-containing protein [Myxococcales bacterium]
MSELAPAPFLALAALGCALGACTGDEPAPARCAGLAPDACAAALVAEMSLADKVAQMHGTSIVPVGGLYLTADDARLGIPGFRMTDGPRGVRAGFATCFPVAMARGATWDPALEERVGEAIGAEAAGKGANVLLAPTMNLLRHPAWGRAQETYGEDPVHLGAMAAAFVTGAQRHVVANAKHFALNSIEDTRLDVDVTVDERTLREIYLPHFARVVRSAGVGSVMSAYNSVQGAYCSENEHLLRDILKGEWGFRGFVMSDWVFAVHGTASSALAGLDVEMPLGAYYGAPLVAAVDAGEVPLGVVDEAVTRILHTKLAFGLGGAPTVGPEVVESAEHAALAREVARAGMVLLKNEAGALPLDPASLGRVALVGALAAVANLGDEGSSAVHPSHAVSPLAGLSAALGASRVTAVPNDAPSAAELADVAAADAAVVVVGLTSADEGENLGTKGGDRASLALPPAHEALIAAVAAVSPRTIVVIEAGASVTMQSWLASVPAVLMAWYPGQEGGHALADLLLGASSPSGRLPVSFPVAEQDLPLFDHVSHAVTYGYDHGYRHLDRNGTAPLFPFGFGLSYTSFDFAELSLASSSVPADGTLEATVRVTNTGARAGDAVVELYVAQPGVAVVQPSRVLAAFARAPLAPGESALVPLAVRVADLAYWDEATGAFRVEPGSYGVEVGSSARELPLTATFTVP